MKASLTRLRHALPLTAALLLGALTLGATASARAPWVPEARQSRFLERGENCSILRTLDGDHTRELGASRRDQEQAESRLKESREAVERCARERGIPAGQGDRFEVAMAEYCGPQYAEWVHAGYRVAMLKQDAREMAKDRAWVQQRLRTDCRITVKEPAPAAPALPSLREVRRGTRPPALAQKPQVDEPTQGESTARPAKRALPPLPLMPDAPSDPLAEDPEETEDEDDAFFQTALLRGNTLPQ